MEQPIRVVVVDDEPHARAGMRKLLEPHPGFVQMWSPDGRKIAFTVGTGPGNSNDVYIMNASGSNLTTIGSGPLLDADPTFSPDGTHIAFTSNRGNGHDLWVIGADGSNPTLFVDCLDECGSPVWSPDGTTIAYLYNAEIRLLDVASKSDIAVLAETSDSPVWAPDGTRLAFAYHPFPTNDVATVNFDGSDFQIITAFDASSAARPLSWSR